MRVQHSPQMGLHAMSAEQGEQRTLTFALDVPAGYKLRKIGSVGKKPFHPASEPGDLRENFGIQGLHGKKGNQPNHGAHLHRYRLTVRLVEHVVIKTVILIPQSYTAAALIRH